MQRIFIYLVLRRGDSLIGGTAGAATPNPVLRTHTIDERQGFMKALVAARDEHILGFTMIGAEAGEVMAVVQMAILAGLPYKDLRDAVLTHPTMAEGLGPLFSNVPPRP
jgi:pyruvate/2-oxoglutarate dehydrogenase complex dihydrolipoamide dehydrogenase (E3) component